MGNDLSSTGIAKASYGFNCTLSVIEECATHKGEAWGASSSAITACEQAAESEMHSPLSKTDKISWFNWINSLDLLSKAGDAIVHAPPKKIPTPDDLRIVNNSKDSLKKMVDAIQQFRDLGTREGKKIYDRLEAEKALQKGEGACKKFENDATPPSSPGS